MKKKIKRTTQVVLVVCMVLNLCAFSSFAFEQEPAVDLSQYDREAVQMLQTLGVYSDEDIALLLEYDLTHPTQAPIARVTYPENPKEGDYFYETYIIRRSQVEIVADGAAAAAIYMSNITGLPAILCATAAALFIDKCLHDSKISAIELTVMYRYGLTDDLTMGWTQTLQNYEFIYE